MIIFLHCCPRYDLTFNLPGYIMVFISDFATAMNGVYTMKKLQNKVGSETFGILITCSVVFQHLSFIFTLL